MVLPLIAAGLAEAAPWILGGAAIGGLTGGAEAYRKSGGDLGKTLLGVGTGGTLGAVTGGIGGGVSRYAGQALAPVLKGAAGAVDAPGLLGGAARAAASPLGQATLKATPLALGGAAQLGSQAALNPLVGGLTNLGTQAVGAAGAAGVPGLGAQGAPSPYPYTQYAVPSGMGQYGPTPQFNPYDVMDPTGKFAASRLAEEKEQDVAIRGIQKEAAALAPIMEGRSKAEFLRQMAAAGIRANIQTQQQNLLGGLATARQMGLTGAQQVGQALASQYQYS